MKLNDLKPAKGSVKSNYRRGRGQGSGGGGTATRGHKGAQSRSGYSSKRGFEGGQMPLQRRLPKFGFKNINRVEYRGINLDILQGLAEKTKATEINVDLLIQNGLASKNDLVKILGRGELKSKVTINVHAFTASAKKAIEEKGGVATVIA
jgi:large subunit ribosomal protein L15